MSKRIGCEFMEKTKFRYLTESDQMKGLPQPPLEWDWEEDRLIDLPAPKELQINELDLTRAIVQRRSVRTYSEEQLSLEELSYLLWCTQGVKEVIPRLVTLRTVPSAGARHAFETFILVNRVQGLEPGLYRFAASQHKLLPVKIGTELAEEITQACLNQRFVAKSAVTFIWAADVYRMAWLYGERGYRYLLLDAGHVCQNLYLAAEAVDCGACAIAAFADDQLNEILSLDGDNAFVVYLAACGKKSE